MTSSEVLDVLAVELSQSWCSQRRPEKARTCLFSFFFFWSPKRRKKDFLQRIPVVVSAKFSVVWVKKRMLTRAEENQTFPVPSCPFLFSLLITFKNHQSVLFLFGCFLKVLVCCISCRGANKFCQRKCLWWGSVVHGNEIRTSLDARKMPIIILIRYLFYWKQNLKSVTEHGSE